MSILHTSSVSPDLMGTLNSLMAHADLNQFVRDLSITPLQFEVIEGIRIVTLGDLSAMKIHAVSGRGSKKVFSDLLYLHHNGITLDNSLDCYKVKYGTDALFGAVRSRNYFDDTVYEPDPLYLNGWDWEYVHREMKQLAQSLVKQL